MEWMRSDDEFECEIKNNSMIENHVMIWQCTLAHTHVLGHRCFIFSLHAMELQSMRRVRCIAHLSGLKCTQVFFLVWFWTEVYKSLSVHVAGAFVDIINILLDWWKFPRLLVRVCIYRAYFKFFWLDMFVRACVRAYVHAASVQSVHVYICTWHKRKRKLQMANKMGNDNINISK